jgi:hypothetical protein
MYDFETMQKFITRRALGKSLNSIAAELGIHLNTARNWNAANKAEIEAERRSSVGMALAAEGAGRIERARRSAVLFNRLAKKLLEDASQSMPLDVQTLGAYIKLCQLLDKIDPPVTPDPVEPGCDLPDTIDLLENVRMPNRSAKTEQPEPIVYDLFAQSQIKQQAEEEKNESAGPATGENETEPEPAEVNTEESSLTNTVQDMLAESAGAEFPEISIQTDSPPDAESLAASEQFWDLYRRKLGRY